MKFTLKKAIFFLTFLCTVGVQAQTTYTWNGGAGAWNVATNWTPTRTTPATNDILQFNDGGTYTVTNVITQTIGQLKVLGNTTLTLQANAANQTVTITPGTGNTGLEIASGSALSNTATNIVSITATNSTQVVDISGTLAWVAGTFTNTGNTLNVSGTVNFNAGTYTATASAGTESNITGTWNMNGGTASLFKSSMSGVLNVLGGTLNMNGVAAYVSSITGTVNHTAGTITGSAVGLSFASGANYNYLATGSLALPLATWDTNSNLNITGITGAATITNVTGQSFGNITYNCTGQGNTVTTMGSVAATYTVKGDFTIQSTGSGTGSLTLKSLASSGTVNATVNGLFSVTGGLVNACTAATTALTLNLNGGYSQTGGTFNLSTATIACTMNVGGNYSLTGGTFTQTSTTVSTINFNNTTGGTYTTAVAPTNTYLNYTVAANGILTLQNNLVLANSRTFTVLANGRLNFGTYTISGVTSTTFSVAAGGTISIGDQLGITTSGSTGNVQTNTRTYTVGANFIYSGTNGQVTGNGLPVGNTGYIQIDLQNNTDQITFTNTAFSGNGVNVRLRSGSLANAITYTNATNSILTYEGVAAQTTTNNEFPASNGPRSLVINNPNGVTLHAARSTNTGATNTLTLTSGILNTTATNVLTVSNATVGAVVGGSDLSYVNGPLIRAINAAGTYHFPVGDGSTFGGYSMLTSAAASGVFLRAQFVNSASGGSAGAGLASLNNYHWLVERTAGTNSVTYTPTLTIAGLGVSSRIGYSKTLMGAYDNVGGVNISTSITAALPQTINTTDPNAYYSVGASGTLSGTETAYTTLTSISQALQTMLVTGNVIFELPTSYSGEPAYPVVFTEFSEDGSGPYTVTIRPATGSANFLTAGDPGTALSLIDLSGIDRLTIDGRAGGAGSSVWTFRNTRTAATVGPTFRFISDATNNTLTYLQVEGQNITATSGTILFSTGTTSGNDDNTISYCHIRDRSDVAGIPVNGIYALGSSASIMNDNISIINNHIYNFFSSSLTSSGILVSSYNSGFTITNNHLYQTASRAQASASVIKYGIQIIAVTGGGTNFTIKDNYIGGSEANAGGTAWTTTGSFNHSFQAISISTLATGNNRVENNVIRNFNLAHGTTANTLLFAGVNDVNGNNRIHGNTIGSLSSTSITITSALATASATYGIYVLAGTDTITSNTIAGVRLAGTTGIVGFTGIHTAAASGNPAIIIDGNTIAKISAEYNGTTAGGFVRGIYCMGTTGAGVRTITNNTIYELSTATGYVGANDLSVTTGITQLSTTSAAVHTITGNIIHSLSNSHASAVTNVVGIFYNGATNANSAISRNFVHSFNMSTSGAATITGIFVNSGIATVSNNMLRLGIDASGNAITNSYNIAGILHNSTTANSLYHFNTIYIGGTGVTGNNNSYAFQRTAGTAAINLRNNIFYNNRENSSGTGINFAIGLNASTAVTSNYNIYETNGSNGKIGIINTTSYNLLTDWQGVFSNDLNSLYGGVPFINANGNAASVNLHINPSIPSQNESNGEYIAVYGDYDGDKRYGETGYTGTGTAPDIGADEGEFLPLDITPPSITYTPIADQTVLTAPSLSATVTDASGVDGNSGTRPRIYYKYTSNANTFNSNTNATDGWKYVESSSSSSPFNFTIDYSLLYGGIPSGGETIQYFVVAQDLAPTPNVNLNSGVFNSNPSSVALTSSAFPLTGTINEYKINVLHGTVTVGSGGDYLSLTNAGGLFEAINNSSLSGNLVAEITSDLTSELGTHPLYQWNEIGGSGYTLTIRPSAATTRTISGNQNLELFRLDGADRVTIDGRFGGSGQYLVFANTSALSGAATFSFLNEATNNTIRYSDIKGSTTATAKGVILFGTSTASGSLGNSNNLIEYCDIHDNSGALPRIGVYSAGTAAKLNANNTISNNNIYNFFNATGNSCGVWLVANTSSWTIENNKFYQEATRTTTTASTFHYVINVNNTSNVSTIIRGNTIGGNASNGTGTMTYTATVANQFAPIYLNTSTVAATPTIVENNTITNIAFTTVSAATSGIGPFTAIYQAQGASRIKGNTIGAATGNGVISVTVNTNSNGVTNGIRYDGSATVLIENNTIGGVTVTGTGTNNGQNLYGIHFTGGGTISVKNNFIGSSTTANSMQISGTATTNASALGGIFGNVTGNVVDTLYNNTVYNLTNNNTGTVTRVFGIYGTFVTTAPRYLVENNTVRHLSTTSTATASAHNTVSVMGIGINSTNTGVLSVMGNTVHSLSNTSSANSYVFGIYFGGGTNAGNVIEQNFVHSLSPASGASAGVIGIQFGAGAGSLRNNMVRLGIDAAGNDITQAHTLYGIDVLSTSATNIFHNSVYIGGAVSGVTALNSFAFRRTATSGVINIQNNIFMNVRTQSSGGKHYSIYTPNVTTFTSDYNILYAQGTGTYTGLFNTADQLTLTNWRTATTNRDMNSLACDPAFINPTGNASAVDLHLNGISGTAAEGRGNPSALSPAVTLDYDGTTRPAPAVGTVDIGADDGSYTGLLGPSLTVTADGQPSLTTCQGNSVVFEAVATGGSSCGAWQFAWFDGSKYWDGTAFTSVTPIYDITWNIITVPSILTGGTYTVTTTCNGDVNFCISPSSGNVNVTINSSPATLTAAIGTPANGLNHYIDINWATVSGVTGYELEYSTDGLSWFSLYSGTNTNYQHNTGDSPNAPYYYRVRSVFGMTTCNWTSASQYPIHTAADAPAVPVLSNATTYTLDVTLQTETPVANPASTTYSIYCPTTGQFVQAGGTLGATEVFQTKASWGTITITGLAPNTNYCFYARAKNNDGDIREGIGSNVLGLEDFTTNANFSTASPTGPTNKFWSPSSCTTGGLLYSATGGCSDGHIGKTGNWTNFFSCFVRTPETNCTGQNQAKVFFDVSNSYFPTQPNDRMRFYMWADAAYHHAVSVKINGVEVSTVDINGRYLPFNMARTCQNIEVTFDLSAITNKSNIMFYLEPINGYNNANVFSVVLDNISIYGGAPDACLSTLPLTISGNVTIGTGGDYPSLTNNGGFFEAVNMATITGNVNATVISDLTSESGTHPLNEWTESGVGNYTITLSPSDNTNRLIEGNYVGANAAVAGLYRMNGADRFIVDGRDPSNMGAGGRHLIFRNTSTTNSAFNSTFNFINDATNDTLRYAIIEGASTNTTNGVVRFSTASAGGNDGINIDYCHIRDVSGSLPVNAIYAAGTAGQLNSNVSITNNEIYNFWGAGTNSSNGVLISSGNTDWTISGNSFYQTASRASGGTVIHYGIQIDNSTNGNNFTIQNNYIGGSTAGAGGTAWTITGANQVGFMGISINIMTSATSLVQGNTIANFNINTTRVSAFPTNPFNGILSASNGAVTINNNTIGASTGTGSITINNASTTNLSPVISGIGHSSSSGDVTITNNTIGSFTLNSSSGYPLTFNGIRYGQGGSGNNRTISGNLIGSLTTANSINVNTGSTISSAQDVMGIYMTAGANAVTISNNTIANMHNNRPSTNPGQTAGIYSPFAKNTITGNTIYHLSSTSNNTGTGVSAAVAGIVLNATSANDHSISQNTIYGLEKSSGITANSVIGIYYGGGTGTNNHVSRNLIHSLSSSAEGALVSGIYMGAGAVSVSNNMIRLGIDDAGTSITTASIFQGIVKDNTSTNNFVYHNSVYIGGSGVSSTANPTYAFRRMQTNANDNVRNNIFMNARSNATSGGNHYSVFLNNSSTLVMSNNILYANGTGGVLGRINTTDYTTMVAWNSTGFGAASAAVNPLFVSPTTGTPDLHLTLGSANPAESGAVIISGLTDDYDAVNVRTGYPQVSVYGGGTAPDIGADENDMTPVDINPPTFTYTMIPAQSAACTPVTTTVNVTIDDPQSGISLVSNHPRMYFRRSVGSPTTAWSYTNSVAGTYISGTSNSSVWSFTLDYALYGITPAGGDEFEYYFVAQDLASPVFNVGTSQTNGIVPEHSDVATIVNPANYAFPANGKFTIAATPLSGTVTVGSGGDYPNFNNSTTGLFKDIMSRGLSGNLEVLVISNVNENADYYPLGVVPEYCGSGYTITIKPNSATSYLIQSNASGANPLINFIGTKRVIIDGNFSGSGRYLTFRQASTTTCTGTSNPTFYFSGTAGSAASEITIKNCIIEGNNRLTACIGPGVLNFGNLLSTGMGMNNIIIDNNVIRNRSDLAQNATNTPWTLIQIGAPNSVNIPRSNIQITNNVMFNFSESAIQVRQNNSGQGIGNNIVITGNKIYQTFNIATYQYPIWLEGGTNSHSHVISNNQIGGNTEPSPNISGTWLNNKSDGEIQAIYVLVGGSNAAQATSIQGNKIQNINLSGTGWTNFVGIRVEEGRVRIGDEIGNIIGSEDNSPNNIISNGSGGLYATEDAAVMGIWVQSNAETIISNNTVSGLSTGLGTYCFLDGIAHGSNLYFNGNLYNLKAGKVTMTNNKIANNRSSSNLQNSSVSNEGMIGMFVYTNAMDNLIEGNVIENNGCNALSANNVRIHGVMLGVFGQVGNHGGIFRKNVISSLANANFGQTGSEAPEINGLSLNYGNWQISNNMISLRNGTTGTNITNTNTTLVGIRDGLLNIAGQGAQYLYNSVYIYGTNGGSGAANASYAFLRFAVDWSIPTLTNGAPTQLRNNILINERNGIGNHRSIGNIASNPAIGWNNAASNYNFVCNLNTAVTGRWGTNDYNWAGWLTQSGGDANSGYVPAGATTIAGTQLKPTDLFNPAYLFGNLRISILVPAAADFVNDLGTPLATVTDDIDGDPRHATTPDIGADEFSYCQVPVFTTQPSHQLDICSGSTVSFATTVIGLLPITYQWQESTDGGSTWANISNGGIYSGANTNTLTLTGVTLGMNNYKYQLILTNSCGVDTSNVANLTIVQPPTISTYSPISFVNSICNGNTSFGVTAVGTSLTYQWQESADNGVTWTDVTNTSPYSGATSANLYISNLPPPYFFGQLYHVIITDGCSNQITSSDGTLNVATAHITAQPPATKSECAGNTATISVSATGIGTVYQWEVSTDNGVTWSNATGGNYSNDNTSTLSINVISSMNGYRFRVQLNSVCNVPVTSDETTLNVEYQGQWLGAGTDWDTPANWGCNIVPNSTTDVVIPTTPVLGNNFPIVSSNATSAARSITIQSGASVTVSSGSDLSVHGNLENNGTAALGLGTVRFVAAVAQQISGTTLSEFGKLDLSNSYSLGASLTLQQNIIVKDELLLNSGKLDLNGSEMVIGYTAVDGNINGGNNSSYVVTDAAGSLLTRYTTQQSKTYTFPVGDINFFTPFSLLFNTSSVSSNSQIQMKVNNIAHPNKGTATSYIGRFWTVNPVNVMQGGLSYNVVYNYADADITGVEADLKATKHNLNGWIAALGSGASFEVGNATYNNAINQITWNGITDFSDFTALGNGTPLPISLLEFDAYPVLENVEIVWTTASEINNDFFTIERSKDGTTFENLMQVPGAGNSTTILNYKEWDTQPYDGISYYRLKQTDFDGKYSYSMVKAVNFNKSQGSATISVYPNPVLNNGVYISTGQLKDIKVSLKLIDMLGKVVQENDIEVNLNGDIQFVEFKEKLSSGVYHLHITNNQKTEVVKLVVQQ